MTLNGYSSLSVGGLAAAVGRTRPTLYRRWPSTAHFALDVVIARYGTRPAVDTGSLREDLLTLQRRDLAMFTDPLVVNSLIGLLAAAERDRSLAERVRAELIDPRRRAVSEAVMAAGARAELGADVDLDAWEGRADFICEVLTGPLLARSVMPGAPTADDDLVHRTVEAALHWLATCSPRGRQVATGPEGNSTAS